MKSDRYGMKANIPKSNTLHTSRTTLLTILLKLRLGLGKRSGISTLCLAVSYGRKSNVARMLMTLVGTFFLLVLNKMEQTCTYHQYIARGREVS